MRFGVLVASAAILALPARVKDVLVLDDATQVLGLLLLGALLLWSLERERLAMLEEAVQHQDRLNELLRLSLEHGPLPRKLERMLECLVSNGGLDVERRACVMVREGAIGRMAAQFGLPEAARKDCARMPLGKCLCGRVAQSGVEILAPGLDERHVRCEGTTPHGHLTLPLQGGGETLGALSLYLRAGTVPGKGQLEFARAAAGIFSGVLLLARSEEQFLQSQKMDAVGRLAGGIAHDFNNVLTAIKGYSAFLLGATAPQDSRYDDLLEIVKAADRATALTRHLLAFSRRQVLEPRRMDLNQAVAGMAKMLRCLLGESIALDLRLDPSVAPVFIDPGQFEQVVLNLAVNARDAMPQGGTLTLSTSGAPAEAGSEPERVQLAVTDTGVGMELELLRHIFEPFFSTKPKEKGTGLGLSTVYGIITQSGGEIEVSSEPGRGSSFRINLPAHRAPAGVPEPKPRSEPVPQGRETVLVVEDEAAVRSILQRALSACGYHVLAAACGEEALGMLERQKGGVDLMITDVVMPRISGPELAARVRAARPDLKVLFISGNNEGALSERGLLPSGAFLLQKPFSPEAIARKAREVVDATGPA